MKTRMFILKTQNSNLISKAVVIFSTALFFLMGCASGVTIDETPLNLTETRRNIVIVSGEPRSTSENGREMTTKYFDRKWRNVDGVKGIKERFFGHFYILGDRRPYNVEVEVRRQALSPDGIWDDPGEYDEEMTEKLAAKVKQQLYLSQDNRNMIDDFKPY